MFSLKLIGTFFSVAVSVYERRHLFVKIREVNNFSTVSIQIRILDHQRKGAALIFVVFNCYLVFKKAFG